MTVYEHAYQWADSAPGTRPYAHEYAAWYADLYPVPRLDDPWHPRAINHFREQCPDVVAEAERIYWAEKS